MNNDAEPWKNFWEDGNGSGTEKFDAFSHAAWSAKDAHTFHNRARQPWIKNYNFDDSEPMSHRMGMTVQLGGKLNDDAETPKVEAEAA